jgi:hypothetical protein
MQLPGGSINVGPPKRQFRSRMAQFTCVVIGEQSLLRRGVAMINILELCEIVIGVETLPQRNCL